MPVRILHPCLASLICLTALAGQVRIVTSVPVREVPEGLAFVSEDLTAHPVVLTGPAPGAVFTGNVEDSLLNGPGIFILSPNALQSDRGVGAEILTGAFHYPKTPAPATETPIPNPDSSTVVFGDCPDADHTGVCEDTYNNLGDHADKNASSDASLNAYTWPAANVANTILMHWDLSALPDNIRVHEARLGLYLLARGGDPLYEVSVHRLEDVPADVQKATWNTYNGEALWPSGGDGGQSAAAPAEDVIALDLVTGCYRYWTVTKMVALWASDLESNNGLLLLSDPDASADSYAFFAPSEFAKASCRPRLVVRYSVEEETATPTELSPTNTASPATEPTRPPVSSPTTASIVPHSTNTPLPPPGPATPTKPPAPERSATLTPEPIAPTKLPDLPTNTDTATKTPIRPPMTPTETSIPPTQRQTLTNTELPPTETPPSGSTPIALTPTPVSTSASIPRTEVPTPTWTTVPVAPTKTPPVADAPTPTNPPIPPTPSSLAETVLIGAGTFPMGAGTTGDDGAYGDRDERPQHEVLLSAYRIGKYETTVGRMCDVLNWAHDEGLLQAVHGGKYRGGTIFHGNQVLLDPEDAACRVSFDASRTRPFAPKAADGTPLDDFPVEATWYGAACFCNWLSEMEGRNPAYDLETWRLVDADADKPGPQCANGYRLPTEAEWEKAACWDGAKRWTYGYGADKPDQNQMACAGPEAPQGSPAAPVGSFNGSGSTVDSPSPAGCYDMSGNVAEWCHDWYGKNAYAEGGPSRVDPRGPPFSAAHGGAKRVVRGGSAGSPSRDCRCSSRADGVVLVDKENETFDVHGFRIVVQP